MCEVMVTPKSKFAAMANNATARRIMLVYRNMGGEDKSVARTFALLTCRGLSTREGGLLRLILRSTSCADLVGLPPALSISVRPPSMLPGIQLLVPCTPLTRCSARPSSELELPCLLGMSTTHAVVLECVQHTKTTNLFFWLLCQGVTKGSAGGVQ